MGDQATFGGPPASLLEDEVYQGPCPFKVGDLLESRAFVEGFRDAWFLCKVLAVKETPGPAAYELTLNCMDFDEDGPFQSQLYERNPGVSEPRWELMLRPPPPKAARPQSAKVGSQTRPTSENRLTYTILRSYAIGDAVEYLCDSGWWAGRISELTDQQAAVWWRPPPHGEGGEECFLPFERLRPAMVWDRGQWSFPGHPNGPLGTLTGCPVKRKPGRPKKSKLAKPTKMGIVPRPAVKRQAIAGSAVFAKGTQRPTSAGRRQREKDALPPFSKYSLNTQLSRDERVEIARKALVECTGRADLSKLEHAIRTVLGCRPPRNPKKGALFKVANLRAILTRCAKTGRGSHVPGYGTKAAGGTPPGGMESGTRNGKGNGTGYRPKTRAFRGDGTDSRTLGSSSGWDLWGPSGSGAAENGRTGTEEATGGSVKKHPGREEHPGGGGVNGHQSQKTHLKGAGVNTHPGREMHPGGSGVNEHRGRETPPKKGGVNKLLGRSERKRIAQVALKSDAHVQDLGKLETALRQIMAGSPPFMKQSAQFKGARWRQLLARCAKTGEVPTAQGAPKRKVTPKQKPGSKTGSAAGTGVKRRLEGALESASSEEATDDFFVRSVDMGEAAPSAVPDERETSPGPVPGPANWWQPGSVGVGAGSGKTAGDKTAGDKTGGDSPTGEDSRDNALTPRRVGLLGPGIEPDSPFSRGSDPVAYRTPLRMDAACTTDLGGSSFVKLAPLIGEPLHAPELQSETDVLRLWDLAEVGGIELG